MMAEDVLVAKLFNYICGSGGFVELAVLLKPSSPLGSRKTKLEAKKWLRTQGPQSGFVCVTDQNDEITGVRVDLRSKICQQYVVKGFCRRANTGNCKYWHICKSYIEGNCDGTCGLSHNFFSEDNQWKAEELGLEKHSNGTVRNIVAWSLPQVCQLYLINKCKSDKCPYLHICSKMVQGSSCKSCDLSHSLTDSHNNKILKQYDLVPPHQVINVDFVRCSILVLNDQKCIGGCGTVVYTDKTTSVVANNGKQNASVLANTATAVVTKPARKQDPPATLSSVASPGKRQDNTDNGQIAKVLFECLCKEFKCSAPLTVLKNRTDVNVKELKDVSLFLDENKDTFLSTRNENGNIQDIIAFCPKLRLCFDFLSLNECQKEHCSFFHLCRKFITGSCRHGGKCSRSHNFRNKRDQETVLKLDLDWLTNEQLRQLMLSSSPRVCISYNKGKCTNDSRCPRLHICKDFVVNACKNGDSCRFQHKWAFDTHHTRSLLEKYRLGKMSQDNVWKTILVCEEQVNGPYSGKSMKMPGAASRSGLPTENATSEDLTERWVMDSGPKQTQVSRNMSSSQPRKAVQERRPSVSSSCSSVAARDKFSPSKKAVFTCICKEYNGSVSFAVISKRQDLFPEGSENIATWFRNKKESFRLTERADKSILEVSAFCRRAGFCFNYTTVTSCSRSDCQYFHVCREYIAGVCTFGSRCKWNHNFQFDQDRKFISKLELDGLTDEELCKVVQLSIPQVCLEYNDGECQNGGRCSLVHICKNFIKKKCLDRDDCGLEHEEALQTPHTTAILQNYGLKCTDGNFNFVLNALMVCKKNISKPVTLKYKMGTPVDQNSPISLQTSSQGQRTSVTKPSEPWTPCFPTEWKVFECLCNSGSSVAFLDIAERKDLFPHGVESAEGWFRETRGSFLITENSQGMISQVDAFSARARPCLSYNKSGKCVKYDCTNLHICRDYVTDSCSSGVTCPLNHHFHNQRDNALLSRINLDQFTDRKLRALVLSSTPQICVEYNNGICNRGDSCNRIHMCCGYLRKCCSNEYECGLDHEGVMHTDHTQKVLERHMLNNVGKPDAMKMILDDKLSFSGKDKVKCHIHQDKPNASICSQFLIGRCHKGLRCINHHCSLPYHWQYNFQGFDEWKSFSEKDNLMLEKLYCDVNVETKVNFKSAQSLDISGLNRSSLQFDQGYEVLIDLDYMAMSLKPSSSIFSVMGEARRLSTVSYATCPCDPVFTNWKWYWKEIGNVLHMYDKDRSGRDLQGLIEHAFLDMLDQGKTKDTYKFTTSEHDYNLFFVQQETSVGEMYQVNLKTGTKRMVKRRPEKPISKEDLEDVKRAHGDSSVNRKIETTAAKSYVPRHWSSMQPSAQYTRVRLATSSSEFEDAVKLFRKSINDNVVIKRIDRVQNPFMWEKYCRKKENMMATAQRNKQQVNEKRLFHGTSPETVEAICKQNFDWRLHGKNATKYGEGSYFAVNASYSHAYAKKDADLSQFMFLAKVLVGSYTRGHSSYRRPPHKDPSNPASDLYDSCVENTSNPTIFVVFDTDQFYPEYIITYSTMPKATSANYSSPQPRTTPLPKPVRSQLHQPRSSSNIPGTASNPIGSAYSSTVSSSTPTRVNPTKSSSTLGTASQPNRSAVQSAYSASTVSSSTPTRVNPRTSSKNRGTASNPSRMIDQSDDFLPDSVELRRKTWRASNPSGSDMRSGYSTSTASTSGRTSVNPTRNSNNIGTVSSSSGSAAQSGYSASTVSSSRLTSVNPTRSSASNPSGFAAQSSYPSNVFNSGPSVYHTSGSYSRHVTPSTSVSSHGFQTAANADRAKMKKDKCAIM